MDAVRDLVGELDRDLLEAGGLEFCLVLAFREGAGDAADVAATFRALRGREAVFGDDIADPDPSARPKKPTRGASLTVSVKIERG